MPSSNGDYSFILGGLESLTQILKNWWLKSWIFLDLKFRFDFKRLAKLPEITHMTEL
jgi:hypothetical protein